jgi:hypothetical protein
MGHIAERALPPQRDIDQFVSEVSHGMWNSSFRTNVRVTAQLLDASKALTNVAKRRRPA